MPETDYRNGEITIADLFPELSSEQREVVREVLDAYCELLFQIFERRDSPKCQKL